MLEGKKIAIACLVERDYMTLAERKEFKLFLSSMNFVNVQYKESNEEKRILGYYYGDSLGTISTVDSENKKSEGHLNCVSLVAFADSGAGPISFLAHINSKLPSLLAGEGTRLEMEQAEMFVVELRLRLFEILKISQKRNLEICLLAGNKDNSEKEWSYQRVVDLLKKEVKDNLNMDVKVLDPHYITIRPKDVFVDNSTRRIYHITEFK
jgi:hypothetical protein